MELHLNDKYLEAKTQSFPAKCKLSQNSGLYSEFVEPAFWNLPQMSCVRAVLPYNHYHASPHFNSYRILIKHGGQKQEKNVLVLG